MKLYRRVAQFFRFRNLKVRSYVNRTFQRMGIYKYRQLSDEESLDYLLLNKNVGIVRFGNSELSYVAGLRKDNQKQDNFLRKRLVYILKQHPKKASYVVGFPLDATILSGGSSRKVRNSLWDKAPRIVVQVFARTDYVYLSPFLFRLKNVVVSDKERYLKKLEKLFEDRNIIYVGPSTGRNSRIWDGINPKVVIDIPESDAFDLYEKVKNKVAEEALKFHDPLVLVVAGITATVLSAELNELGVTTYDLGQVSRHVEAIMNANPSGSS